ncbi:hypothetical protein B0H66DRAFT_565439 [Apodospora peruviana]|uniref:Uncharacterized protein n=1 Tax=Apodospora peruviana TaxID=516989 RepID=A0AAE0HZF5_9PEZI|nr:hypothetical protein B0H66DRAFT_565439 [Apodospora peruviana]
MGFKKYIPGLKPKPSTANISGQAQPLNANYPPAGYTGYPNNNPQNGFNSNIPSIQANNIYPIPESGAAHQQQQAQAGAFGSEPGMAMRPGPAPSFETSRSVSSGSAYSNGFSNSTNSLGARSSVTTTSSTSGHQGHGLGAGIRNFSSNSGKSSSTAKGVPVPGPVPNFPDPQITAADVRRCTKLLRQMFELHLELWTLMYTHGSDQPLRLMKKQQVDAILVDIHNMVGIWNAMPRESWTEEEYEEIKWIAQTLVDLPPPQ